MTFEKRTRRIALARHVESSHFSRFAPRLLRTRIVLVASIVLLFDAGTPQAHDRDHGAGAAPMRRFIARQVGRAFDAISARTSTEPTGEGPTDVSP